MLTRRLLLSGVAASALSRVIGPLAASGVGLPFLSSSTAAASGPRPDQRDPTSNDDSTQGNVVGRLWLNTTTGRLWQATDVGIGAAAWSDQGVPSPYPGDSGAWLALLGTKPLTSTYAKGTRPFVDVFAVDKDMNTTGPYTINFMDGVIDTATIHQLQGSSPATAGMPEDGMCTLHRLLVSKWYDQSGNNHHYVQAWLSCAPALWMINGSAEGTGQDSVRIAFSRNSPSSGFRSCDRHLALTAGRLSTRSSTIYSVCQSHEASNDTALWASVFDTSSDAHGVRIATPSIAALTVDHQYRANVATWRLVNPDVLLTNTATRFSTSPTVLSVALGAGGVEFATNDDIASLPVLPAAVGTGSVIGASSKSWNGGNPGQGAGQQGFYGTIDAVLVRATADNASTTRSIRHSLHSAFGVVPQAANDAVVLEGDSGTVSWGGVFPLIPYTNGGYFHLADIGIDGYGLNWMIQRRTSRLVRFVQLGRVGVGWVDPATDTGLNSFSNRLPALKAQYNPTAKCNICVAYSHGTGIDDGNPGTAVTAYGFMVSWLTALRSGGQNWTVILGLPHGGVPGGGFEAFNNLIVSSAALLKVSCFMEIGAAELAALRGAPNQLINLYIWNETNGQYTGHGTPLAYTRLSPAWTAAIDAVL